MRVSLRKRVLWTLLAALSGSVAHGQIFGTVRGSVVDRQQGVIAGASVMLKAHDSAFRQETQTDLKGEFTLTAVPADTYTIEISHDAFQPVSQLLEVRIGSAPKLHFVLEVSSVKSSVDVTATLEATNPEAASPPVSVTQEDILRIPGADRTSSLAFITAFTPGAFVLHDHLHIRGGHQVDYLIDGVPVPNTNTSSNVGRALDPKDIQDVEINRGGYSARYGDRTFGVVNIITRSGFEFENEGELTASYGSFNQSNDQLSFGGHSRTFAYYASVSGNRTDLGLEPPTEQVIHNAGSGLSGFASLTYNSGPKDQFRLNASVRQDHYQIPNFPQDQAAGFRDIDQERDSFVNFSWVHTLSPGTLLTVSPFYHYNNSQYNGGASDPLIATSHRTSNYAGVQTNLQVVHGPHNLNAGLYGFAQHDDGLFSLATSTESVSQQQPSLGGLIAAFANEQYKPWQWLTLNAGLRLTHYSGSVSENAANPRLGVSVQIPKLKWVVRGFYGTYYQAPPLYTVAGPLLTFSAFNRGFGFLSLHGERDIQREVGLTIPLHGWILDLDRFSTTARNFLDHDVLGNSNITLPLTIEAARIQGSEAVVRSPEVMKRARFHVAYSNMIAQGRGAVTGGATNFQPPPAGYFYLDHDQRTTLSAGAELSLPRRAWFSTNVVYGSGFLKINGPEHLPQHTTGDISFGKSVGEHWSVGFTALNISNTRYLQGLDSAFAGTHYSRPREFIAQVRYRFHY